MKHLVLSALFILAITGGSPPAMAQQQKTNKSSTFFFEEDEPTLAIKPLGLERQGVKEAEMLASSIRKIAVAPAPPPPVQTWTIEATDVRLVDAFSRWAKKSNVQLRWDAARHVEIGAIDTYEGDLTQAMISALSSPSIANSDFPLEVCFYPNRPALARVTRRGEQWRDCPLIQAPTTSISTIQK